MYTPTGRVVPTPQLYGSIKQLDDIKGWIAGGGGGGAGSTRWNNIQTWWHPVNNKHG